MSIVRRFTCNMDGPTDKALERAMKAMDTDNQTDAVSRAIKLLDLWETSVAEGCEFLRRNKDGSVEVIKVL